MSESVILCEGYHDRAFWAGWLLHLGCTDPGLPTPGHSRRSRILDPWNDPVTGGQFAYHSKSNRFLRVQPCGGKNGILPAALRRLRLAHSGARALEQLILNIDPDIPAGGSGTGLTGLRQQDVLRQVQQLDPGASLKANGHIEIDGGAATVALIRWETNDPPAPGLPDQQKLERLVCAALAAAYPQRAKSVQDWLAARANPPLPDPKEHAWSYMAGWYAGHGCEDFYTNLWRDAKLASELEARLRSSGAWQIAETLAG
jgi:hypothetical protein